jgi:hypothetical protein
MLPHCYVYIFTCCWRVLDFIEYRVRKLEYRVRKTEFRVRKPEYRVRKPESESENPSFESENPSPKPWNIYRGFSILVLLFLSAVTNSNVVDGIHRAAFSTTGT